MVVSTLTSPGDQPGRVGAGRQPGRARPLCAVALAPPKPPVHRLPRPVGCWHIRPRRPDPRPPPDSIGELPRGPRRRTTCLRALGPQPLQDRPLRVGQVESPGHRYGGHEVLRGRGLLVDEPSTGDLALSLNDTPTP